MKCNTCGKMNCMAHGGEAKKMPKPKMEVEIESEPMDDDMDDKMMDGVDDELNDIAAGELLDAFEKKDKQGILDAIKALVLNMKE